MYIDLLDSTKSGHPMASNANEEWWRATTAESQHHAISIAQAAMMIRLLYGDTIVLSHNQIFDSYAWMSACENLMINAENIPFLPITWASHGVKDPTPDSLIDTAVNIFCPTSTTKFKLSAWPGLDLTLRKLIAENIKTSRSFNNMFKGVPVDSSLKPIYEEQQFALIIFHEYLQKNYKENINWTISNPTAIKGCRQTKTSIWDSLNSKRDEQQGIPGEVLDEIEAKINPQDIENRSDLYSAISELDVSLRARIRQLIDFYYNQKIGESTTNGVGLFSILDQDPTTPISLDDELLNYVEDNVLEGKNHRKEAFQFLPEDFSELSTLKFYDCINILKDPEVKRSLLRVHNLMDELYYLQSEHPLTLYKHWKWRKQMDEWVNNHQILLANKLSGKVAIKNKTLITLIPSMAIASTLDAAIIGIVSYFGGGVPMEMLATGIGTAVGVLAPKLIEKINPIIIPTSASARIRRKIRNSAIKNY